MPAPVNPNQLRMLMPAGELRGLPSREVTSFPDPSVSETLRHEWLWQDKQHDNQTKGYKGDRSQPVVLSGGQIHDGHHRIQEAYDRSPDTLMAVRHG